MPDVQKAWAFLENSEPVASAEQVEAAVQRLASEIHGRLGGAYPLVLAVMGGAVVFAGQILPRLRFPLDFDYIHASRYGAATRGAQIEWRVAPPAAAVKGRAVLVLDDILDGGETMAAIRARLLELGARIVPLRRPGGEEIECRKADQGGFRRPADRPTASSSAAAWTPRASGATCRRSAR